MGPKSSDWWLITREHTGTEQTDTQRRRPCDDGGRLGGHHHKSGYPQDCRELQKARRDEEGFSQSLPKEHSLADPLISDF